MLVTLKSAASGDLIMFEKNGKEILALLGKDPEEARVRSQCAASGPKRA